MFAALKISRRLALALAVACMTNCLAAATDPEGATLYTAECASCHDDSGAHTPSRETLAAMPTGTIIRALETGVMRVVGNFRLNGPERIAVAEHITGKPYDPNWNVHENKQCVAASWPGASPFQAPHWNGWGNDLANTRFQSAEHAKLTPDEVPKLELQWAFAFPGETIAESQPSVVEGRLFVGSRSGTVYALDAKTACVHWQFNADAPVKTSVVVGAIKVAGKERLAAFFGDLSGIAYAVDAANGELIWRRRVDEFPASRLMGSFSLADGQLYVPVTASESTLVAATDAVCCVFRGSVVSLDPATGSERWRRYTIDEEPKKTGKNT